MPTDTQPELTLDYWTRLVRSSTHGLNDEEVARAAQIALDSERSGEQCGAWHAAALAVGAPERCICYRCRPPHTTPTDWRKPRH